MGDRHPDADRFRQLHDDRNRNKSGGAFAETVTGSEAATQMQTGDQQAGEYIRTVNGNGTYR